MSAKPPVVMAHGAFCGGWVFDAFRKPFEAAGHVVLTPDLPGHDAEGGVAGKSMSDYARALAQVCESCEEPPILIGHSLGGLAAQLAAGRTPLSALILLAPSAPWGVYGVSMEEGVSAVSLYALGPYWLQAVAPDYMLAKMYSLDRMSSADRRATYARMVPESGRALWETLNWWLDPFATTIAPTRIAAPVLALVGEKDVIHPPATVRQTGARLGATFHVFPGMSHWLPGEPGWEAVADHCLIWLARELTAAA
jgi:pimeloyl-ACP methyl ester carboxylesterase